MALATLPVVLGTGDHASRPAAADVGSGGIYSCTDHNLIYQTDGSSWTTWATVGGGSVATDAIWDAAGDLALGTGANAAARLPIGSNATILTSNGTTASWQAPAAGTTFYPPPIITQYVDNGFTSGTSIALPVASSAAGVPLVMFVAADARVADSITQTNVTWTKRKTFNGNSKYFEVWTGVASGATGTTATVAFTGSNSCAASFIELDASMPDFTTVGTEVSHTSASDTWVRLGPLLTAAGDFWVWGVAAGQSFSINGATQPYIPLQAFGGYARFGIGRSNGGRVAVTSMCSSANAFAGWVAKIS